MLPGSGFERERRRRIRDVEIEDAQYASLTSVRPLAKLSVTPVDDFPFLAQVRRHDPVALRARAYADPGRFPGLDEQHQT